MIKNELSLISKQSCWSYLLFHSMAEENKSAAQLLGQLQDTQKQLDAAREKDRQYIKEQVMSTGFSKVHVYGFGSVSLDISIGDVHICGFRDRNAWWCQLHRNEDEYDRVTDAFIAEQGWTMDQVSVLDWAFNMAPALEKYWTGDSPFDSIEELVAHEKENSPRRFSLTMTKRAASDDDDATKEESKTKRSRTN